LAHCIPKERGREIVYNRFILIVALVCGSRTHENCVGRWAVNEQLIIDAETNGMLPLRNAKLPERSWRVQNSLARAVEPHYTIEKFAPNST